MSTLWIKVTRWLAFAAMLTASGASLAEATSCGARPVRFASVTWKSGQFYTELARTILHAGYGCRTELVEGTSAETEAALAGGRLQVWVEIWGDNASDTVKQAVAQRKVRLVGNLLRGGSVEGWFVPEYVVKGDPRRGIKPLAPDLVGVEDLPRYRHLFQDAANPDKGLFLNCPFGWECEKDNNQKLKAYGLHDSFTNHRPSSGAVLDLLIAGALAVDKPLLFYYWSPAALMAQFKLVRLKEPAFNEACWKTIHHSTTPRPCGSATPPSTLQVGVTTAFAQEHPALVELLSRMQLDSEQINRAIFRMTERKLSGQHEARDFLRKNPKVWQDWVPDEVARKVAESLQREP